MMGFDILIGTGSCIQPSFEITLYVIYGGVCEYPNVNISPAQKIFTSWNENEYEALTQTHVDLVITI